MINRTVVACDMASPLVTKEIKFQESFFFTGIGFKTGSVALAAAAAAAATSMPAIMISMKTP